MIPTNRPVPVEVWTFSDHRLRTGKGLLKLMRAQWLSADSGIAVHRGQWLLSADLYATPEEAAAAAYQRLVVLRAAADDEYNQRIAAIDKATRALGCVRTTIPEATDGP